MADEAKVSILLEAEADEQQIKKEADRIAAITEKQLEKKDLIIEAKFNQVRLEQLLWKARQELKQFKKKWDEELELTARMNIKEIQEKISSTKSWIKDLEKEIGELEKEKTTQVTQQVENIWEASKKSSSLVNDLIWSFWKFLAIWTLIKKYIEIFNNFQKSQQAIVKATGATGEQLKQLTDDMVAVSWKVNQSQWEIAEAVGELNTRLWISGEELQKVTEDYLNFAYVTGQDWKEAIAENIKLFNQWWISTEDQAKYLDKLALAGQKVWIDVWTLTSNLQKNAALLKELWFSLDDSIALLSNFEQAGVEASSTLQSMKIWLKNLAQDWESPAQAFERIVDEIENTTNSTDALNKAFETFWNRGWLSMYNAIRSWTLNIKEMKDALDSADWIVTQTRDDMETFWEFLSRKWEWIMTSFAQWNDEWFRATKQLAELLADQLKPAVDMVTDWFNAMKESLEFTLGRIGQIVRWERELTGELTKKWQTVQFAIQQQQKLNQVSEQYKQALDNAISSINILDETAIDDSATQSEFEASKQAALEAAEAFRVALSAKLAYTESASRDAHQLYKNWEITLQKRNEIVKANNELTRQLQQQRKNLENEMNRINNLQFTPWAWKNNNNNKTPTWWGKSSKNVKSLKEELEEMRNLELDAIEKENISQEEKYKKYLEIYDKYKDQIVEAEGKTYEEMYKKAQEYIKEKEDSYKKEVKYYEDVQKVWDKAQESIKKYQENVAKVWEEWEKVKKKAQDSIRDINNSLKELDKDYASDMGERFVEVEEKIKDFERKNWSVEWLKWIGIETLKNWDTEEISWIKVNDAIEYLKLLEEQKFLNKNITQEIKDQVDEINNVSKAQQIQYEYEQKKLALIEKRNILEAVANSTLENPGVRYKEGEESVLQYFNTEKQGREDIKEFENTEYARQVLDNQTTLNQKLEDLETAQKEELDKYWQQVIELKKEYEKDTKNYKAELDNKKKAFADYVREMNEIAASLNTSARAYWWTLNSWVTFVGENWPEAIVARQSSYVQPRNAVQTYSTINNNQSSFSINWMNINVNSVDEFLNELKNHLTYRN